jgi:hypothetical protein
MQVVEWIDGLAPVAQTPSQEAVVVDIFQFCHQDRYSDSYSPTQQSPLNNIREVAQGLQVTGG